MKYNWELMFVLLIIGIFITFIILGLTGQLNRGHSKYYDNPQKYGQLQIDTYITGYYDNQFLDDNKINELVEEISREHSKVCDNVKAKIINRNQNETDIDFYGDCYIP